MPKSVATSQQYCAYTQRSCSACTAQPCLIGHYLQPDCLPCLGPGSVLAVSIVQACSQVKLQGFARQDRAWSETNATVAISLPLLHDCSGAKFPPASAEKTIINRYMAFILSGSQLCLCNFAAQGCAGRMFALITCS